MSTWGNPFGGLRAPKTVQDGRAAAEKAQTIGAKTDRERDYIAAVVLLYKDADTQDQRTRTLAYEKAMEKLHATYPQDREAAAFYALTVDQDALHMPAHTFTRVGAWQESYVGASRSSQSRP